VGKKETTKPTQTKKAEIKKVDKSVVEKGGYSSSNRTASELPVPPPAVTRRVTNGDRGASTEGTARTSTSGEPSTGTSAQDGSSAE
jgi:hypothetical protein